MFKIPATKEEFWREKIGRNQARDAKVRGLLSEGGWRVMTVWECALRGRARLESSVTIDAIRMWLAGSEAVGDIQGHWIGSGHTSS
jgi:DNA mismatch endonuclease (patch repair protein)